MGYHKDRRVVYRTIEDNVPSTCCLHIPREWWVRVWQQPIGRSCPVLYDDIPTTDAALEDCEDHSPAVHTVHETAYYALTCKQLQCE